MSETLKFALKTIIWRWLQFCALARRNMGWSATCRKSSLVLVPCEPGHVIGSRGDEAMVYAILTDYRHKHPNGRITIIVSNKTFSETLDGRRLSEDFPGVEFATAWMGRSHLMSIYKTFIRFKATEVYVIGADCMDGYYVSAVSFTLLFSADIATRLGVRTSLTGFSFNDHPTKPAVSMFRHVTTELICNVRDPVSLRRVQELGYRNLSTRLVSDVAFMLEPVESKKVTAIAQWVETERKRGQVCLAFNLHGMLVGKSSYDNLLRDAAKGLGSILDENKHVSVLLVPHDYRPQGDIDAVTKIAALIPSSRIRLVKEVLSAAELKALMGHVDCLFTSRMHLGIAALGMGKPVAAFAYQGKFDGLFKHFGLPQDMIVSPEDMSNLKYALQKLVDNRNRLTECVKLAGVNVFSLSKYNLI